MKKLNPSQFTDLLQTTLASQGNIQESAEKGREYARSMAGLVKTKDDPVDNLEAAMKLEIPSDLYDVLIKAMVTTITALTLDYQHAQPPSPSTIAGGLYSVISSTMTYMEIYNDTNHLQLFTKGDNKDDDKQ